MKTIRVQIVEDDADFLYLLECTLSKDPRSKPVLVFLSNKALSHQFEH